MKSYRKSVIVMEFDKEEVDLLAKLLALGKEVMLDKLNFTPKDYDISCKLHSELSRVRR